MIVNVAKVTIIVVRVRNMQEVTRILYVKIGPQNVSAKYFYSVIGRAKRAPHWGVQSRFRVIYTVFPRIVSAESILFRSCQLRLLNEGGY